MVNNVASPRCNQVEGASCVLHNCHQTEREIMNNEVKRHFVAGINCKEVEISLDTGQHLSALSPSLSSRRLRSWRASLLQIHRTTLLVAGITNTCRNEGPVEMKDKTWLSKKVAPEQVSHTILYPGSWRISSFAGVNSGRRPIQCRKLHYAQVKAYKRLYLSRFFLCRGAGNLLASRAARLLLRLASFALGIRSSILRLRRRGSWCARGRSLRGLSGRRIHLGL